MSNTLDRAAVDLVVFDFDGVLTDNRVLVLQDGTEAVFCSRADGLGFEALHAAGLKTLILSTEQNPVVAARAKKLKVEVMHGIRDKGTALRTWCTDNGFDLTRTIFAGNDVNDLSAMRIVAYAVAPSDASAPAKAAAWRVLDTAGGYGVAREIAERILGLTPPYP